MREFFRWLRWWWQYNWSEVPVPAAPLIVMMSTMAFLRGPMCWPAVFIGDFLGRLSPLSSPEDFKPKWSIGSRIALWLVVLAPFAAVGFTAWWLASLA